MKGRLPAFEIALSAVSCAFATLFLSLGVLNEFLLATGYIVGCFALMLPLTKDFILGDILAYVATVLLTLLFGGISTPWRLAPFILFFGLHPLLNHLQIKFKWNKIIALIFKIIWFDITAYIIWRFVFEMTTTFTFVDRYILPVIAIGGSLFFVVYDRLIFQCQRAADRIIYRIKKK